MSKVVFRKVGMNHVGLRKTRWRDSNIFGDYPDGLSNLYSYRDGTRAALGDIVWGGQPTISTNGVIPGHGPLFVTEGFSNNTSLLVKAVATIDSADIVDDTQILGPLYVYNGGVKLVANGSISIFESSWVTGDTLTLFGEFNNGFMRAGRLEEMETPSPVVVLGSIWVDDSLVKYRQNGEDGIIGPNIVELACGRNDFESFQILIHASGADIQDVDVSIAPFSSGTQTLPDVVMYKQHYVDCTNVSRVEFSPGMYPDALIPKVDPYYNEPRNGFPFNVHAGLVQGVWVDVGTLSDTIPGQYQAKATITSRGAVIGEVIIKIRVLDFEIPSTSTFHATSMFDGGYMGRMFGFPDGFKNTEYFRELTRKHLTMGLRHRLSIRGSNTISTTASLAWNGTTKTFSVNTWSPFDAWETPAMDGSMIPNGTYAGAKKIAIMPFMNWPGESSSYPIENVDRSDATQSFLNIFWNYMNDKGWEPQNTLFIPSRYDEPVCTTVRSFRGEDATSCEILTTLAEEASALNGGQFRRTYVNASRKTGLEEFDDYGFHSRWFQKTTCPEWDRTCEFNTPQPRSSDPAGRDYWLYMGCTSTACGAVGNETYSDQVDVCADAIAMYNRLPGFLFYVYEATGTPFWSINTAPTDPWRTLWRPAYDGYNNGDGMLVYPGIADGTGRTLGANTPIIGGTRDIPIESLRLKHWRDFLEDIEICRIAEAKHGREAVMAIVKRLFTTDVVQFMYWNLNLSVANFRQVRNDLLALAEDA